jgi:outer membrane protein assembly factor BamB
MTSEDGFIYALDVASGALRWKSRSGARMAGSPAVAYGTVFIPAGTRAGSEGGTMTAGPIVGLDARTGERVWQSEVDGGEYLAAVCLDESRMYQATPVGAAHYVLDLATGRPLKKLSAGWTHQNRPMTGMVRWQSLLVVPGSMKGSLCVWDLADGGRELWKTALSGEDRDVNNGAVYGHEILAAPAVSRGRIFAGANDGRLYAFDARTGRPLWRFQTNGPVQSSPAVAGDTVYLGSWDGYLYALDAANGELQWKLDLGHMPQTPDEQYRFAADEGGRIISSPWPADGMVYVGCDDGCLYAVGNH